MRKFICGFLQDNLKAYGLGIKEALILEYLYQFFQTERVYKITHNDKIFCWIANDKILSDLPILNIGKRQIIRIINKMRDVGVVEVLVKNNKKFLWVDFESLKNSELLKSDKDIIDGLSKEVECVDEKVEKINLKTKKEIREFGNGYVDKSTDKTLKNEINEILKFENKNFDFSNKVNKDNDCLNILEVKKTQPILNIKRVVDDVRNDSDFAFCDYENKIEKKLKGDKNNKKIRKNFKKYEKNNENGVIFDNLNKNIAIKFAGDSLKIYYNKNLKVDDCNVIFNKLKQSCFDFLTKIQYDICFKKATITKLCDGCFLIEKTSSSVLKLKIDDFFSYLRQILRCWLIFMFK